MSTHSFVGRLGAIVTSVVLLGSGCGSSPSSTTSATSSASAPTPVAVGSGSGGCSHPYFPLQSGYEVVYKDTYPAIVSGAPHVSEYSWRVTNVTANTADVTMTFGTSTLTATQHLQCSNGQLSATNFVDMAAGSNQPGFTVDTRNATGAFLPTDLHVGSEWDQSFDLVMHPQGSLAGTIGDISETTTIHHKALREESVTVPAGTYTALRIESHATMQLHGSGAPELGAGNNVDVVTTEWWVKNVGLVKSSSNLQGGFEATAEAQRISF